MKFFRHIFTTGAHFCTSKGGVLEPPTSAASAIQAKKSGLESTAALLLFLLLALTQRDFKAKERK